jgi:hypothetical protein
MPRKITKIIAILLSFSLLFQQVGFAQVAGQLDISTHLLSLRNSLSQPQDKFRPLHLRYLDYEAASNNFKLLLDKGDTKDLKDDLIKEQTRLLMSYFQIGLALPNDSFWVNLRPDSPDNIIDPFLERTDLGKVLLEADLQLKRDTARATSPQTPEGKLYWDKLYKKAGELFGTDNVTIPTLVRPWIVPGEIIIRETPTNAYIYKATLKVMLEEDYLKGSATYSFKDPREKFLNQYSSQLIKESIIPKLTKEINTSKKYAALRQVYYSLILAQWFKTRNRDTTNPYPSRIDRKDLTDLTSKTPWFRNTYFNAYQKSFKDGEYNLKEQAYSGFGQVIRTYTSGGIQINIGNSIKASSPLEPGATVTDGPVTVVGGSKNSSWRYALRNKKFLIAVTVLSPLYPGTDSQPFQTYPEKYGEAEIQIYTPFVENMIDNLRNKNTPYSAQALIRIFDTHSGFTRMMAKVALEDMSVAEAQDFISKFPYDERFPRGRALAVRAEYDYRNSYGRYPLGGFEEKVHKIRLAGYQTKADTVGSVEEYARAIRDTLATGRWDMIYSSAHGSSNDIRLSLTEWLTTQNLKTLFKVYDRYFSPTALALLGSCSVMDTTIVDNFGNTFGRIFGLKEVQGFKVPFSDFLDNTVDGWGIRFKPSPEIGIYRRPSLETKDGFSLAANTRPERNITNAMSNSNEDTLYANVPTLASRVFKDNDPQALEDLVTLALEKHIEFAISSLSGVVLHSKSEAFKERAFKTLAILAREPGQVGLNACFGLEYIAFRQDNTQALDSLVNIIASQADPGVVENAFAGLRNLIQFVLEEYKDPYHDHSRVIKALKTLPIPQALVDSYKQGNYIARRILRGLRELGNPKAQEILKTFEEPENILQQQSPASEIGRGTAHGPMVEEIEQDAQPVTRQDKQAVDDSTRVKQLVERAKQLLEHIKTEGSQSEARFDLNDLASILKDFARKSDVALNALIDIAPYSIEAAHAVTDLAKDSDAAVIPALHSRALHKDTFVLNLLSNVLAEEDNNSAAREVLKDPKLATAFQDNPEALEILAEHDNSAAFTILLKRSLQADVSAIRSLKSAAGITAIDYLESRVRATTPPELIICQIQPCKVTLVAIKLPREPSRIPFLRLNSKTLPCKRTTKMHRSALL